MACEEWISPIRHPFQIPFVLYSLIPAIIAVVCNGFVVYVVLKRNQLRTKTNILIASLAFTDLVQTLVNQIPFAFILAYGSSLNPCYTVRTYRALTPSFILINLSILVFLTRDRYHRASHGLKANQQEKLLETYIVLALVWIFGFLTGTGFFYLNEDFIRIVLCVHVSLTLFFIFFYYRRFMILFKRHENVIFVAEEGGSEQFLAHFMKTEKRCLRAILLLLLILALFMIPFVFGLFYVTLYKFIIGTECEFRIVLMIWTSTAVFFNAAVNPFLYAKRYKGIGDQIKRELAIIESKIQPLLKPWKRRNCAVHSSSPPTSS